MSTTDALDTVEISCTCRTACTACSHRRPSYKHF